MDGTFQVSSFMHTSMKKKCWGFAVGELAGAADHDSLTHYFLLFVPILLLAQYTNRDARNCKRQCTIRQGRSILRISVEIQGHGYVADPGR